MIDGNAIFQRMWPSRVVVNVAAYSACALTRWIGCEVVALGLYCLGYVQINYTWFDERAAVSDIHIENLVESCRGEYDAAPDCQRAAGQSCAGPPWHERNLFVM